MSSIKVLYEDNHLIAVFKPSGVLSQGDKTSDISMYDLVKDYIKEKKNKKTPSNPSGQAGNVFLGLLHRLDRPVSGIILFAKTSKGASRLSEQFRNHDVEKIYHAIVIGKPAMQKGKLTNFLGKDTKTLKARNFADGKEANLYYEIIKFNNDYSLLKIKLETGMFHQIRSQLSLAGFPILGDVKYALPGRSLGVGWERDWNNSKAIALCATGLSFYCATEDKKVDLSIPIPESWQKYI